MSGPNFSEILSSAKLGEIEKPKPMPIGSYEANIVKIEFDKSSQKKTPLVRFHFSIVQALEDVSEDDLEEFGDVVGKKAKTDFYLTDAALHMLQDFILYHVGLDIEGTSLEEAIPQCQNNVVGIRIKHEISQRDNETVFAVVDATFSMEDAA